MTVFRIAVFAATAALSCGPALAQRRGAPIEAGVTSSEFAEATARLQSTTADLNQAIQALEAENARLNGRIETLEFLLRQASEEQERLQEDDQEIGRQLEALTFTVNDLKDRLAIAERNAAVASDAIDEFEAQGATDAPANAGGGARDLTIARAVDEGTLPEGSLGTISVSDLPSESGALFAEAKSRLLQFEYAEAEVAFKAFLDEFGSDPQAGEAQYWLAEVLYQQEAYAESGQAYTAMIREHPDDPRAPDALVKLARSMRLVGETERACAALETLPVRYPDASAVTKNLAAVERSRSACPT